MPEEDQTTVVVWDHEKDVELHRLTLPGVAHDIVHDEVGGCMYIGGTHLHRVGCFDPALEALTPRHA